MIVLFIFCDMLQTTSELQLAMAAHWVDSTNLFHHLMSRGYDKNCVLYPGPRGDEIILLAVLCVYSTTALHVIIRAAGLIALTRRLTRLSINRVKIFNRALIVNFPRPIFRYKSCLITLIDLRSRWITTTRTRA